MRQRYFTFLMLVIVLFACNKTDKYLYPNDPRLSDANGFPTDTSRAILPFSIKYNGKVNQLFLDSSQITEYNKRLNFARCPLLYNYYLNKEIYRFSAFCSIRGSAIFTIYHDHSGYFTNFKVTWDYKECVLSTEVNEHFKCHEKPTNIDKKYRFIVDSTVQISRKDWKAFKEIMNKMDICHLTYDLNPLSKFDGSDYVIEMHTSDKYWMVLRMREDKNVVSIYHAFIKIWKKKFKAEVPNWVEIRNTYE